MSYLQINNVNLEISAVKPNQYPRKGYPEIALVGRSNVGKSTLTNALIHRRSYARTSNQPGKTQTLNFYNVENQLYLVDIPGYGYAKVSKTERERWANMIDYYLTQRTLLKGAILLIDGRRAPSALDVQMKNWFSYYRLPTLEVATKMDKVKRSRWNRETSQICQQLGINSSSLALFSAKSKMGCDKIWSWIQSRTDFNLKD